MEQFIWEPSLTAHFKLDICSSCVTEDERELLRFVLDANTIALQARKHAEDSIQFVVKMMLDPGNPANQRANE